MDLSKQIATLTRRKKVLFFSAYLLFLAMLFFAYTEYILRKKNITPWRVHTPQVQVKPGGRFFKKHPTLGYTHIPGRFKVSLGRGYYSFLVTHLPNTLRITHPLASYDEPSFKEEIWLFGDSFTHGWGINDYQTYPWMLQQRLQECEVVNFGCSGYGTIHSLIQFREALELKTPKIAVLAYADFHDERNTFLRTRRKAVAPWNKLGPLVQPYALLDKNGSLQYFLADVEYTEFPMMRHLAFAHFVEIKWNQIEQKLRQSHKVSEALIMEMARLAEEHDVYFVIASIAGDRRMLEFAKKNGIPSVDISVDLRIKGYSMFAHPTAIANKLYADKLKAFLKKTVLKQTEPDGQ